MEMDFNQRADQILAEMLADHEKKISLHYESSLPFNEEYFRGVLEDICEKAGQGTGLSYDYYIQRTSQAMSSYMAKLSDDVYPLALELAKREFDYCDAEELAEQERWNADNGFCQHGIEFGCCPAGCEAN